MYDIFFLSYSEPNADKNWKDLKSRFPHSIKIENISGIHNAHKQAAKKSLTEMFWVVDADAEIVDNFNFDYLVSKWEVNFTHVWKSINPVNDLEYGYGAVKLLPKKLTQLVAETAVDFTTSISDNFKIIDQISNVTKFNTDPFNSWKSGFREAAKLQSRCIKNQKDIETQDRLEVWCSKGKDKPFGDFVISGAIDGKQFIEQGGNLSFINDYQWLTHKFEEKFR
jgi:hypothetical protein